MTSEPKDTSIESAGEVPKSQEKELLGSESSDSAETSEERSLFPVDAKWFEAAFYGGVLVWIAWLLLQTRGWSFEDRLFPCMAGLILMGLLIVQLGKALFPGLIESVTPDLSDEDPAFEIDTDRGDRSRYERQKYELLMIGWVIALPLLLNFVGFILTIPIYLFAFLLYFLRDTTKAAIISALTTAAIYVLFVVVLNIRFPS
ncbi:tripartite tricarboxylate transporter TctB family protein [Natrinema soli]|uniref:Tripartite tricarboxylate transporter TctB family protein n=1 Tax=Natrinema soli TaxID=1930624 RepID=A0ABD5SSI1_9EURY|nr:tripartite tricarboxylate transporter TctB family protein [Natrinema soli]